MTGEHIDHSRPESEFVEIDGHLVDTSKYSVDRFYSGRTGERVTDAQWDAESALRAKYEIN